MVADRRLAIRQIATILIGILPKRRAMSVPIEIEIWRRLGEAVTTAPASQVHIANLVVAGLAPTAIETIRETCGFERSVLEAIVPKRTLSHRIAHRQALTPDESDRAVRLVRIKALADQAFANPEKADKWLRRASRRFGARTPIDVALTEAGARWVEQELQAIAWGAAA